MTHRITLLQKEAEKLAETLGQFIPDEPVKTNEINGPCHGSVGGSRHRAASVGGRATGAR